MSHYARTLNELREQAVLFWPPDLLKREAAVSVWPLLLQTQDKFINVLTLADSGPEAWKPLLVVSEEMTGNLFLKHLMVLSDLGGTALNNLTPIGRYFPDGMMNYSWREEVRSYTFQAINCDTSLENKALHVDGAGMLKRLPLTPKMEDVAMLILHGGAAINDTLPEDVKNKCVIATFLGQPAELNKFVRQRYIYLSRQIHGAASNKLGQVAQDYVIEHLKAALSHWKFKRNGSIPGISQNQGRTNTSFDIVALSPTGQYIAIEVSFQFTANSVIERKAGQAVARKDLLHAHGHKICYVLDGAGNINVRTAAVGTLCANSDCTVALSANEIKHLAEYLATQG